MIGYCEHSNDVPGISLSPNVHFLPQAFTQCYFFVNQQLIHLFKKVSFRNMSKNFETRHKEENLKKAHENEKR